MPVFAYKVYNTGGSLIDGVLTADTPAVGRQVLREQGYRLVEFEPVRFRSKRTLPQWGRKTKRQEHVAELARQLSMLLRAGVSLVDALDVLIKQKTGKLMPVLRDMRDKVAAGMAFSDALDQHPGWFDEVFRSAVKVGQLSGNLDKSLTELALFIRERQTAKSRLFSALAYPAILAILGTGVVLFLMTYVIPQLLTVLEASGGSLPRSTVFLKHTSDFLTTHWKALACLMAATMLAAVSLPKWPAGLRWFHSVQLRVPVIGGLIQKSVVAQFSQAMSLLLHSGVPFLESIRLVRSSARNLVLRDELQRMEEAIQRGSDIAPTLEGSKVFPPLVIHIMDVGQNSGELTDMLTQLKVGYDTEVRLAVAKTTAVLEPVLIVIMSAVVGFVVFATMMPILEATRAIQ